MLFKNLKLKSYHHQDLSLNCLLHLEELLRKILLLPQSAKVQGYTKERLRLKLIPMLECLRGLTTAQDLSLETSVDDIFNFIINNPGFHTFIYTSFNTGFIISGNSLSKKNEDLQKYLSTQSEDMKRKILSIVDMSLFSKEELLSLLRRSPPLPEVLTGRGKMIVFKDLIKQNIGSPCEGNVVFCPQHWSKIK